MKFGISMFTTDRSAGPAEVAKEVEARGFDSFWVSEHSHIPLFSKPPFPGFDHRMYSSMLDPFVALGAAASVTSRIKLGTAICLVTQHDPFNCAKSVASLDRLSNGRVLFGIGAGWNEEEMRNHGTDPSRRFRLMRERVEAMKVLWSEDEAEYHGELVNFDPVWQWPKPTHNPHPPILIGGAGPNVLKRVVAYGDGWLPVVVSTIPEEMRGRQTPMEEFVEMVPALRRMAEEAGRQRPSVSVTGMTVDADVVRVFTELGVDRMILRVHPAPIGQVRKELDQHRRNVEAAGATLEN
jgi:probable F420-dependent oxidoreductase